MDAQGILVDRDFQLVESLSNCVRPDLETPEPVVRIDLPKQVGCRTGDQAITVGRMIEQPTRRDDIASDDQGHRSIKRLQGDGELQVLLKILGSQDLPQARRHCRFEAGLGSPTRDCASENKSFGLLPIRRFRRRQSEHVCRAILLIT
ncbi:hypothetical protein ES703_116243 [subsurface metagenome]